jgi:hypothetical protein
MPLPFRSSDRLRRHVPRLVASARPRITPCLRALLLGALTLGGVAAPAHAQGYPFSQRGSVTQHVAHTTIAVEYGRPVARGRALFGQLVPWDSVWHPGADSATRISFDHPVRLEGQEVRAGEYSLWLFPRASGPWTVILSRAAHVFHKPYPGAARDAYRIDVSPERGAHMESLAIYFPSVLRADAVLRIHWGETVLPIRVSAPYSPP